MTKIMKFFVVLLFLSIFLSPKSVIAQTAPKLFEAKIIDVKEAKDSPIVRVEITQGEMHGKKFTISQLGMAQGKQLNFHPGDGVMVSYTRDAQGKEVVYIVDYIRRIPLLFLLLFFIFFVAVIGRWKGILSFLGMILSFVIIGQFIVPQITLGNDPIIISLFGALFIIPITFYISHGINKETTVAIISTFLTLLFTGILAYIFVVVTKLTGFASEEAVYIQAFKGGAIDIRSLLLAGIIIGAMGVLDDITISQVSIVDKLAKANPKLNVSQLFSLGMEVGRDHIASLVNTLVLVYAGASLPLFLLFYGAHISYGQVINQEIIATEIVRTLVSSIGIIAAVPLTTLFAAWVVKK